MSKIYNVIVLLREFLEENNFPAHLLIEVLDKYTLSLDSFLAIVSKLDDQDDTINTLRSLNENEDLEDLFFSDSLSNENLMISDIKNSVVAFRNVVYLSSVFSGKGKN